MNSKKPASYLVVINQTNVNTLMHMSKVSFATTTTREMANLQESGISKVTMMELAAAAAAPSRRYVPAKANGMVKDVMWTPIAETTLPAKANSYGPRLQRTRAAPGRRENLSRLRITKKIVL